MPKVIIPKLRKSRALYSNIKKAERKFEMLKDKKNKKENAVTVSSKKISKHEDDVKTIENKLKDAKSKRDLEKTKHLELIRQVGGYRQESDKAKEELLKTKQKEEEDWQSILKKIKTHVNKTLNECQLSNVDFVEIYWEVVSKACVESDALWDELADLRVKTVAARKQSPTHCTRMDVNQREASSSGVNGGKKDGSADASSKVTSESA